MQEVLQEFIRKVSKEFLQKCSKEFKKKFLLGFFQIPLGIPARIASRTSVFFFRNSSACCSGLVFKDSFKKFYKVSFKIYPRNFTSIFSMTPSGIPPRIPEQYIYYSIRNTFNYFFPKVLQAFYQRIKVSKMVR